MEPEFPKLNFFVLSHIRQGFFMKHDL